VRKGGTESPRVCSPRRGVMILAFAIAPLAALFLAVMTYAGR
jgi:hypothetical protein